MIDLPYLDLRRATEAHASAVADSCQRVVESGWFILGEELSSFEDEWAHYCGARHTVGVGNGLDGLELILSSLSLPRGAEVLVPSNTYIATWLAVTNTGLTVKPVEPDPHSHNLTAESVAAHISSKTGAVLAVHLFGRLADEDIHKEAQKAGIPAIFDSAQAHGARTRDNRSSGNIGDAAAFSFYPTKNLGALGDGGAVTTSRDDLAEQVRLLRNYGSERKYENRIRGRNSRLDEMQAAILRTRLLTLEQENNRRRQIAGLYSTYLSTVASVQIPSTPRDTSEHVWHAYNLECSDFGAREVLRAHLEKDGIGTQVFYPVPPHMSRAYRDFGWHPEEFPIARSFADTSLAIPIAPYLTDSEVERIANSVSSCPI